MTFMEEVVLREVSGRVIIFFDEIDSALPLLFSDDFFTTIRALINARANNPALKRLNFVILGVARPSEFIKNRSRTPFNIGRMIELRDFEPSSLRPFKEVSFNDQSPTHARLKLAGVVRVDNQKLAPRNRIYERVFGKKWVKENTPRDTVKIVAYSASSVLTLELFSSLPSSLFPFLLLCFAAMLCNIMSV